MVVQARSQMIVHSGSQLKRRHFGKADCLSVYVIDLSASQPPKNCQYFISRYLEAE